jgi:FkbM family methyltransferase
MTPAPTFSRRAALLRRWPLRRGRRRLARALGIGSPDIPASTVVTAGPLGLEFRVFPDDVYFDLFFFGEYEPFETAFMLSRLGKGVGMVDVGASFGWFTVHAATALGDAGWVRAFEPQAQVLAELKTNLALNRLAPGERLACSELAVGERSGFASVRRDPGSSHAYASFLADARSAQALPTAVRLESLDALHEAGALPDVPAFVKCDVEGGELGVLEGARGLCAGPRKPTWLLEVNRAAAARAGWPPEEMIRLLRSWGYGEFLFVSHAVRPRHLTAAEATCLPANGNLIACPPEAAR